MALHFLAGESRQTNWHNSAFHGLFGLFRWIPLNFTFCAGLCGFGSFLLHFFIFSTFLYVLNPNTDPKPFQGAVSGGIPVDSGGFRWVPVGSGSHLKLSQICHISGGRPLPALGPGDRFSPENLPLLLVFRWECFSKLFCACKMILQSQIQACIPVAGFQAALGLAWA